MADNKYLVVSTALVDKVLAEVKSVFDTNIADQIFTGIPAFHFLYKKNKKTYQGGNDILIPVNYAKNTTAAWYNRYGTLSVTPMDTVTSLQYKWKTAAVSVSLSGVDLAKCRGKEQIVDMLSQEIENAKASAQDLVGAALFTATPADEAINSIPLIAGGTDSVGGHDGTTDTWWAPTIVSSAVSFAAAGLANIRTTFNTLCKYKQTDKPDFMITSQTLFEYYENLGQPQQVIQSTDEMDLGFQTLMFKKCQIFWDENCGTDDWYLLNSNHLGLVVMAGREFSPTEWVKPANQDVKTMQLLWMGNLVTNERRKLGSLTDLNA